MAVIRGEERTTAAFRIRRSASQSVEKMRLLAGNMPKEDIFHLLITLGLTALYDDLGIERNPAASAEEMLTAVLATWAGEMSDDEIDAFAVVRRTLARIDQIRVREAAKP